MSELVSKRDGDILVVRFTSQKILADAVIEQTGSELVELAEQSGGKMIVDFQSVNFLSSLMIGKIIMLRKRCKAMNVDVKLCNVCPSVKGVFEVTRLDRLFEMYDSLEEAKASFDQSE